MKFFVALTWLLLSPSVVRAQSGPRARTGYLTPEATPDVAKIVPPAPQTGDVRFEADMAIYRATRSLEGSPRWAMALSDDQVSQAGIFKAFSCALGVTLTAQNAPKTSALITRANADAGRATGILKNLYGHNRPFQVEEGNVCLSPQGKTALERSPDYPSGHTAASWEAGLVLAELVPEKATGILERARAFGQSRVVCGVHNASAVEAGWLTATAIFAAQNGSAEFRADVEAASAEVKALLENAPPENQSCRLEAEVLSQRPY